MSNQHSAHDVVTQSSVCVLWGKNGEAVRMAIIRGRVRTRAQVWPGPHPYHLLDVGSCAKYWGPLPEGLLAEMRSQACLVSDGDERFRILTPPELRGAPFIVPEPLCQHVMGGEPKRWPCEVTSCGQRPTWFRSGS